MKPTLTRTLAALLCLLMLCACGAPAAPAQTEAPAPTAAPVAPAQTPAPEAPAQDL